MSGKLQIALLEPFFAGSHARWAEGYAAHSRHSVRLFTLPGRHWKWRMHGAALSFARMLRDTAQDFDLILATDMLDLATMLGLLRTHSSHAAVAVYFHENQLTYPWSPTDSDPLLERDMHYGFINLSSALAADAVLFNSSYHRSAFLNAVPDFLRRFPDARELESAASLSEKSEVLPYALELETLCNAERGPDDRGGPLMLWNHRWEYDKAPETLFAVLGRLAARAVPFRLAVAGQHYEKHPDAFDRIRRALQDRIVHWGYCDDRAAYENLLLAADIVPVTSIHDFFGAGTVEAIAAGALPLLPRRLAYPEHIPAEQAALWLYENDTELEARLEALCLNWETPEGRGLRNRASGLRRHVTGLYDWKVLAPRYDGRFEKLVESKRL